VVRLAAGGFLLSPAEVGQIVEEAYVYGFPMIMGYR
jgi:hypothetical protein